MHICQLCKKAPASIHLTDIHNNVKKEMHICEACAQEKGFNIKTAGNLAHFLEQAVKKTGAHPDPQAVRRRQGEDETACPRCGLTWKQFNERGRLGCPDDYRVFGDRIRGIVAGQFAPRVSPEGPLHVGKIPGSAPGADPGRANLLNLRRRIRQAVVEENYEAAAALKAEMDSLRGDVSEKDGHD